MVWLEGVNGADHGLEALGRSFAPAVARPPRARPVETAGRYVTLESLYDYTFEQHQVQWDLGDVTATRTR